MKGVVTSHVEAFMARIKMQSSDLSDGNQHSKSETNRRLVAIDIVI